MPIAQIVPPNTIPDELKRRRKHPTWGERYWIELSGSGNCWIWTGSLDPDGYGRWREGFKLAHRVVYEALVGPIPAGMELDHTCYVRECVNPAHLEVVTGKENRRRMVARRQARAGGKCGNGHDLSVTRRWNSPQAKTKRWWCTSCVRERRERERAARDVAA